jgi:hypothetical protein
MLRTFRCATQLLWLMKQKSGQIYNTRPQQHTYALPSQTTNSTCTMLVYPGAQNDFRGFIVTIEKTVWILNRNAGWSCLLAILFTCTLVIHIEPSSVPWIPNHASLLGPTDPGATCESFGSFVFFLSTVLLYSSTVPSTG